MISGYTGQGVATSNLSGRLLASLVNKGSPELATLPLAQCYSPNWEMEPLRWLVVRYVQKAFMSIDDAAEAGRPQPWHSRMAQTLGRHCGWRAPCGFSSPASGAEGTVAAICVHRLRHVALVNLPTRATGTPAGSSGIAS